MQGSYCYLEDDSLTVWKLLYKKNAPCHRSCRNSCVQVIKAFLTLAHSCMCMHEEHSNNYTTVSIHDQWNALKWMASWFWVLLSVRTACRSQNQSFSRLFSTFTNRWSFAEKYWFFQHCFPIVKFNGILKKECGEQERKILHFKIYSSKLVKEDLHLKPKSSMLFALSQKYQHCFKK